MSEKMPEASPTYSPKAGSEDERPPIPRTVDHDDFLAAVKPLLNLLNVTAYDVYSDLHITGGPKGAPGVLERISFNVVTPDASMPSTLRFGENGELSVHVVVDVI